MAVRRRAAPAVPDGPPKAWSARIYTKFRRAWVSMKDTEVTVFGGYESAMHGGDERFGSDTVAIRIKSGKYHVWMTLNRFTAEEIQMMKQVFNHAFDLAIPVAESMDRMAEWEMERGAEDLSPRLFKLRPVMVIRQGWTPRLATPDTLKEFPTDETEGSTGTSE